MRLDIGKGEVCLTICEYWNSVDTHWKWLAEKLGIDYLYLGFRWKNPFWFNISSIYFDGPHSCIWILGFYITWGGKMWFKKMK